MGDCLLAPARWVEKRVSGSTSAPKAHRWREVLEPGTRRSSLQHARVCFVQSLLEEDGEKRSVDSRRPR